MRNIDPNTLKHLEQDLENNPETTSIEFWDGILAIILSLTILLGAATNAVTIIKDTGNIQNLNPIRLISQLIQEDHFEDISADNLRYFNDSES